MYRGQHWTLVDTPGFDDTYRPDTLIFRELAAWLAARYQENTQLTAIVYLQRITDTRVSGGILRNLTVMKRMLGVESFPYLTLVTSMWDICDVSVAEGREQQLKAEFWKDLLSSGARTGRFWGNRATAHRNLDTIASGSLASMKIQKELVDHHLLLDHTSAGSYLEHEITGRTEQDQNLGRRQDLSAAWNIDYGSLWLETELREDQIWNSNIYEPLKTDEIRVLELFAGSNDMPVEFSLQTTKLSDAPPFAAISYVVGQQQGRSKIHLRQGVGVLHYLVATNVQQALSQLRCPCIDILLWIDALCINQEDHRERAEQVRKMFSIYSRAKNVCIWLGIGNVDSERALSLAKRILDLEELEKALKDESQGEEFILLARLMCSPWFSRRWCVQEIMLAKEATVHSGKAVMLWSDFADVVALLSSRWLDLQDNIQGRLHHMIGHTELIGAVSLVHTSQEIFRKTSDGEIVERVLDLEALLCRLASFDVTILHDAVYAILGLASDVGNSRKIQVDYSIEPQDLFRNVIELIVRSSGSLNIICRPWAPKSGLPSWITTTARLPFQKDRRGSAYKRQNGDSLVGAPGSVVYRACGDHSARGATSFRSDGSQLILSVKGIEIGEIKRLSHECVNGTIHKSWRDIVAWDDVSEPAPDTFWRSLVADRAADGSRAPTWYKRACESAFRQSLDQHLDTKQMYENVESTNIKEFLRRMTCITWSRVLAEYQPWESPWSVTFGRVTKPKSAIQVCLCPSDVERGDKICVLYGCSVPVILRQVNAYHILIGECFVHGIMEGEAFLKSSIPRPEIVYDIA